MEGIHTDNGRVTPTQTEKKSANCPQLLISFKTVQNKMIE